MINEQIELANSLVDLRDNFSELPEWNKNVEVLAPLILMLMKDQNTDNPIKAIMGPLRDAKDDNDLDAAQLMLAVAVDLTIKLNNV